MDLTWRISRGRDRCTATAAPYQAATIACAKMSEQFAPIGSSMRSGKRAPLIRKVSLEQFPRTRVQMLVRVRIIDKELWGARACRDRDSN